MQVILYDMGSGSTQAALIKYSTYGRSKSSQTNQFEVLDVAYDHSLGSNTLDLLLLKHFAEEFKQKGGEDIRYVNTSATGERVCERSLAEGDCKASAEQQPSRPRCTAPGACQTHALPHYDLLNLQPCVHVPCCSCTCPSTHCRRRCHQLY